MFAKNRFSSKMENNVVVSTIDKKLRKLCVLLFVLFCPTVIQQIASLGIVTETRARRKYTSSARYRIPRTRTNGNIPKRVVRLFSKPSEEASEENAKHKSHLKQWDNEESLLVMNLSPLPSISAEESLTKISQYIRSFPFAAVLPVQPLQALPTDDGGLEIKFLRKKTHIKSGVDGGVRFFVHRQDERNDSIEVLIKRNSDGQCIPKMFAEKLIVQSFVKGMALGSDHSNDCGKDESSAIRIPNTRIESPTIDVAKIQSVFHKWI